MLSIAKINSAANQVRAGGLGKGYAHYLGEPSRRTRSDFDDYARGKDQAGLRPFWACSGAALLGLDAIAEADHVERLAKGFHPLTGKPLVKGAGDEHVMGLDMTFSAPKDFSAVFAGADSTTQEDLLEALREAARSALAYAEAGAVTRHGHGGRIKQAAEAAIAACYTHFASRVLDPQLHVHAFMLNVGKRKDSGEWSALEQRTQFDRKLATGILFRAELAHRLNALGFEAISDGPYFTLKGIDERQREALSTRSREIAQRMKEAGLASVGGSAARDVAALNSRRAKSEPPLPELLAKFQADAKALGITPESVAAMRTSPAKQSEPLILDHGAILQQLMESQSCATSQEALAIICEQAMGRWSAAECLAELDRFMAFEQVVHLGRTEHLTPVFTSKATRELEASIDRIVGAGAASHAHRIAPELVERRFNLLESELRSKLGVEVSLGQQRAAALSIACDTGRHALLEGWAGTGKTTMLKAVASAYAEAGLSVLGCCQSAAAAQNLARETGIPSRTIASLLLSLREGRAKLGPRTILVLDEAGMVGSAEFALLQEHAMESGSKLVCVGDPKQLQPIGAGGIFGSLMKRHGKAEISAIQRQRTDFGPLMDWLEQRAKKRDGGLTMEQAKALRQVPEDGRMQAMGALCSKDAKLSRAFAKWRARFDFEWMRQAVESFAKGEALLALEMLDARGRLKLISGADAAMQELISAWSADKTPLPSKAIVAATRAEVAELNRRARESLISAGHVRDEQGVDAEIIRRDETRDIRRFAPGDRVVFTMNDRPLGVVNGAAGTIKAINPGAVGPLLDVELDDANERGERRLGIPIAFGRFDHAYCRTNHRSQGQTFDSAYVLANPSMADREWTYVAASRSRFATTLFVDATALGLVDAESHRSDVRQHSRADLVAALAARMKRSRAKGTTLDYALADERPAAKPSPLAEAGMEAVRGLLARIRSRREEREMSR